MREWNLKSGDPLSLTLAADARLDETSYNDDQIWELKIGGGDPPAIALHTTYGLRARSLRLFPRFTEDDIIRMDPTAFDLAPLITQLYPNFLTLKYSPLLDIDVIAEYWVPQSQAVAGRLQLSNNSKTDRQIRVEWVGQLTPTDGQPMAVVEMHAASVLSGHTGNLAPVVFITGGPKAGTGSYPSLTLNAELPPGRSHQFTWAHAALTDPDASFELARDIVARKWEAERSRLVMVNASLIDIYTGDPDWDIAFMLTQKKAFELFVGPTQHLPNPSFVLTRQPDQGYSLRGDGSDYNHFWNGQSPLESHYLANLILPIAPHLVQGLFRNFLAIQTEDGAVDWKPGLAGQRSHLLATPLLTSLAWRIFETTEDKSFLKEAFPGLLRFVNAWFTPQHDRDGDGVPEWDHTMQSGSDDHPVYSHWHAWSSGIEITTAESPALCAFLHRECHTLIKMAEILGQDESIPALRSLADHLQIAIEASWNPNLASYQDWDRDTHFSTQSDWLGGMTGSGTILIERSFEHPIRLLINIQTPDETKRRPQIFVHGTGASGHHRVERITDEQFKWYLGRGILTSERVYASLEKIEVQSLEPHDQIALYSADYNCLDHTVLAPLWAGIPSGERAKQLVEETITNPEKFWRPFGLPACVESSVTADADICHSVNLLWNTLVGEGLIEYGYRNEAAELVTRLMAAIVQTLKRDGAFRRYYLADTGEGVGERNALSGLAPLGLFLDTVGVRLISPHRVAITGYNPFPWPVTVKFRGMTVLRQKEKTIVIFPDGQTVSTDDPSPRIISLEIDQI